MRSMTTAGLVLLLALATASAWWLSTITSEPSPSPSVRGPDWYFNDASMTAAAADGTLRYRLHADRIVHAPQDGSARGESIRMEWLQGDPMRMYAAGAVVSADGMRIHLEGGVRIVDESERGQVVVETGYLDVDSGRQVATTLDAVTMTTANGKLEAVGLTVDAQSGLIRFERSVRGLYVPR